jgi:V8-like Glu-specific endopeptidase
MSSRAGILFLILTAMALALGAAEATAEGPAIFGADQYGAVDLVPQQAAGMDNLLESLGTELQRFEPMNRFNPDDPFRMLGRGVGRLEMLVAGTDGQEKVFACTAALIAKDLILTNAHCIPGRTGIVRKANIRFGYLEYGGAGSEQFEVDTTAVETDSTLDYSIVHVQGNPGGEFGIIIHPLRAARDNESLYIIHHPGGQPQKLTRAFCRAFPYEATEAFTIKHQCDTMPGSSGSLIFAASDGAIVGLHHTGGLNPSDEKSYNRGTDALALRNASHAMAKIFEGGPTTPMPAVREQQPQAPVVVAANRPTETASSEPSFLDYARYGMEGADIGDVKDATIESCKAACGEKKGCVAYSVDIWNRRCFLKSRVSNLIASPQYFTAIRDGQKPEFDRAPKEMKRYRGKIFKDAGYAQTTVDTYEGCLNSCNKDARCTAVTFMKSSKLCKLIEAPGEYFADIRADSGVKSQYP